MIKFYCDMCNNVVDADKCIKIDYKVTRNSRAIDNNFVPGIKELGKDFCVECARKFIGQRTIDKTVAYNIDRKKRMAGEED